MATKRSAPDVHPSRVSQMPNAPSAKRRKPNPHPTGQSFKRSHTVNDVKSNIRSLTRLLASETADLPANIRVEKERALASAKHELEETQKDKRKKDMIGRYHKVRFFDRQKATKRLKRFEKACKTASDTADGVQKAKSLGQAAQEAKIEINYAIYYPLDQPYVALFPSSNKVEDTELPETESGPELKRQGDQKMWDMVKKCTQNGSLDALRNGKLTAKERPKPLPETTKTKTKQKTSKAEKATKAEDSGDESDGGFFE